MEILKNVKKNNIEENFGHAIHNQGKVKCKDFGKEDCPTSGPNPSCEWKDNKCKSS